MENDHWLFVVLGVLALAQLTRIARSVESTAAMTKRLLAQQGIEWKVEAEPSQRVAMLALHAKDRVAAIRAYREQTGLGLREAKAVVDELARTRRGAA